MNTKLKNILESLSAVSNSSNIPVENTVNLQGHAAYDMSDELKLVTLLNTTKMNNQFYRSAVDTIYDLRNIIVSLAGKDPYFVAQAIIWSRCMGEGMRSVNHLAAALLAPYLSGYEWSKRFFGKFDRNAKTGGCIYRADDMNEIKNAYTKLYNVNSISNAMKKGFASAIEKMDEYTLKKYSKTIKDISNMVHPNASKSVAGDILNKIMHNVSLEQNTWEYANSEAGQLVAEAVREGKLTEEEAKIVLAEAKNDNWEELLTSNRLGIIAALRNIRSIMKDPRKNVIDMWCKLITSNLVTKELVLPCYFDLAYDIVSNEFSHNMYAYKVMDALQQGYENSIPNLENVFTGRTAIIVDCSGSMGCDYAFENAKNYTYSYHRSSTSSCSYKAGLIAATIAKVTNADIIKFGSRANYFEYDTYMNVFDLAHIIGTANHGGTDPSTAFELLCNSKEKYDRIIFISDNEVNSYNITSKAYKKYINTVCDPYIYAVDLAGYGTTPLAGNKISYFYGYGASLYDAIKNKEFNAENALEEIRKIVI